VRTRGMASAASSAGQSVGSALPTFSFHPDRDCDVTHNGGAHEARPLLRAKEGEKGGETGSSTTLRWTGAVHVYWLDLGERRSRCHAALSISRLCAGIVLL
jgi:hypothetical protein